jgi:ribonuclease HI
MPRITAWVDGSHIQEFGRLGYAAVLQQGDQQVVVSGNTHRGKSVLPAEVFAIDLALRHGATRVVSDRLDLVQLLNDERSKSFSRSMRSLAIDCPAATQAIYRIQQRLATGRVSLRWSRRCSTPELRLADKTARRAAYHLQ